ncbi:metal-dependent hydrolase [Rubrivirga sp. S365]|uniref:Metal-dependent hydrolase n=1 Tax=Rubrivirga litoralis TaxID=3075598 RepID=A0ABU3BPW8_9BACT|nr:MULTISPECIES: metal-dependent hydrolase [unclassified Rubrivirga]MDT0631308.1 metal-dependent hydrolase [Rubrivirga sp. F394]MDT7855988.1 metal-dependent hydrolase [Rubrivirga sp. S365]
MAGYRGHLAGATVFYGLYLAALALVYSVDQAYRQFSDLELVAIPIALFGLCLMFGLWPDVDTNSKGQNLFYSIFFVVDVVLIATRHTEEAAYLGLFCILPALGKHRGWTHTTWAMLLIPSPLLALPLVLAPDAPLAGLPFYGAAVVGYFSHLVMDGLVVRLPGRRRRAGW